MAFVVGCEREEIELLEPQISVAKKSWDGILLEFGSPRATPLLGEGWSYGEIASDGNTFRWAVREHASFRFESPREGRFLAWLECEPFEFEGSPSQFIQLSVNGEKLEPIGLRPGRGRYPADMEVRTGENEVTISFRYAGEPAKSGADRRHLAAAFYRFELPFSDAVPTLSERGAFARVAAGGGEPGILLPEGGELSLYAEPLGEAARLRVRVGADAPELLAAQGTRVNVEVRSRTGELLSHVLEAREPRGEVIDWQAGLESSASPIEIRLVDEGGAVLVRPELFVTKPEARPEPRPEAAAARNLLVIFLDGANALRMGLYGYSRDTTPNIDKLGAKSVVFETAVSQAVYTIASIGSVLTAQYPDRHQSVSFADRLREDAVTFPVLLSEAGYRTAAFSGNAVVSKAFGLDRGYEEFFQVRERKDYTGHGDSVLRSFLEWLDDAEKETDERFCAYLHFREPHFPYDPPSPFDTKFGDSTLFPEGITDWASQIETLNDESAEGKRPSEDVLERIRALYDGNMAYVDSLVGKLLEELERRGLSDDTIVIVTADHGEAMFEHGYIGHNTQLYEESIRVPLVIHIPGTEPRRVASVVELVDLAPTILELAGAPADGLEGKSLFAPEPERIAFSRTVWDKPRYSARGERYKLIWDSRTDRRELYDLQQDPGETTNIYEDRPFLSGLFQQRLFAWLREQERLRAATPPPESAVVTDEQREIIEDLGYTNVAPR
jgi:choline-sulfatase